MRVLLVLLVSTLALSACAPDVFAPEVTRVGDVAAALSANSAEPGEIVVSGHASGVLVTRDYPHLEISLTIQASGTIGVDGGARGSLVWRTSEPVVGPGTERIVMDVECIAHHFVARPDGTTVEYAYLWGVSRQKKKLAGKRLVFEVGLVNGETRITANPASVAESKACSRFAGYSNIGILTPDKGRIAISAPTETESTN